MKYVLQATLASRGFGSPHYVAGRGSVADLFRATSDRCGVYALEFADGAMYVGQAVDVVRRFSQHRKTHIDITRLWFRPAPREELDRLERETIEAIEETKTRLRNIVLVSMPLATSDFDLIMPQSEQERWLDGDVLAPVDGSRVDHPNLRLRYRPRYEQLLALRHTDEVLDVLSAYGRIGIPAIRGSEIAFWACTCLPSGSVPGLLTYTRVNLNWQEVFTVYARQDEPPAYSFHVARSVLEAAFGASLRPLRHRYRSLVSYDHRYRPGGPDQVALDVSDQRDVIQMLADAGVVRAIRTFNLRLCRKGPNAYGRYHCMDLADHLVGDDPSMIENPAQSLAPDEHDRD